jgi:HSP20 family molecular chaperone IbpA
MIILPLIKYKEVVCYMSSLPEVRRGKGRSLHNFPSVFDPFDDVDGMFRNLWTGFENIFSDTRYLNKEGDIVFEIEVPGFNKENLSVEIADGILTVQGERNIEGDHVGQRKIYKRLQVGRSEEVDAEIKDGILYLCLKQPKKKRLKLI